MNKFALLLLVLSHSVFAEDIFTNQFESLIASRVNTIALRDPHLFTEAPFVGCADITETLNNAIVTQIQEDGDNDGFLDSSLVTRFSTDQPQYLVDRPLNAQLIEGQCTDALTCTVGTVTLDELSTSVEVSNLCLGIVDGSTSGYVPAVQSTDAPCYVTQAESAVLSLNGVEIALENYQQAARYLSGITMDQGLHRGFVSEATAEGIVFPNEVPLVGGQTLFDLLPGGGSCSAADDRDLGPDGQTQGWWFYFNSESDLIQLSDN